MITLHIFGNPYLENDAFAIRVARQLTDKVRLEFCKSPDDLLHSPDRVIHILDVVRNTEEPVVITDPAMLKTQPMMSLHDFDLGFFLNLLQKMGMDKKVKIIGIPQQGEPRHVARKVEAFL